MGTKLELATSPLPSRGPTSGREYYISLCSRDPQKGRQNQNSLHVICLCTVDSWSAMGEKIIGQVPPSGHLKPAMRGLSQTAVFGPWNVHWQGLFPNGGT